MDIYIIQIYSEIDDSHYHMTPSAPRGSWMVSDREVDESFVERIVALPKLQVIQTGDYLSEEALKQLDKVFSLRPDITFRIYGWSGEDSFKGWNLGFLSSVPNLERLIVEGFPYRNSDISMLGKMPKLRSLIYNVYFTKDYSFLRILPKEMESLNISAELRSGKVKLDFRDFLRFPSLHTLHLEKVEGNPEPLTALKNLRSLCLRGCGIRDLSFLRSSTIENLAICWTQCDKIDWDSLKDIPSLRTLELLSIKKIEDISFIATLSNLENLRLVWMGSITRLPDLSMLENLREVTIDTCNKLTDISALDGVKRLEKLTIGNSKHLESGIFTRDYAH